ncbi:uncharacterized protein PHACADRAFT_125491 [Phanerochaete carnosa HHB-10118-sp]|uniref:HNH nuclease domain-containing protein n=1 Tax=Phanerochaete carnosa (strain HHB-10118-sp) TaxID=650164 RepID=K5UUF4_PHACS|nr:uncharacterized protein PHACADRAFT_125491 [Phanerochaete carnosa HHB-10118-sp]EKM53636.1 hypothetical protein PHACADRAFT_125491 [Phanerochaete carnosa HHB-10118-sp]
MSPTPLPPSLETSIGISVDNNLRSAYSLVLDAEYAAASAQNEEAVMHARIVGFLMIAFHEFRATLGDQPISRVSTEVRSSSHDLGTVIYDLGLRYRENLLRAFRQAKGPPLPPSSECPSRSPVMTLEDMLRDALDGSGKDYRSAKKRALARDGFRCMLTGEYDISSIDRSPAICSMQALDASGAGNTNCCHVLSESTLQDADPGNPDHDRKRNYAASVLSVLHSFGLGTFVDEIVKRSGIHHLSDILTMVNYLHVHFDNLKLWLEGTNTPNEYKICVTKEYLIARKGLERTISFQAQVPGRDDLPLPDPRLLAIHAACARTLHMSGAAEYIDKCDWDAEDIQVLAEDGSSHAILLEKINRIAVSSS